VNELRLPTFRKLATFKDEFFQKPKFIEDAENISIVKEQIKEILILLQLKKPPPWAVVML